MWVRRLASGQEVSYDDLPLKEVSALRTALDEWEMYLYKKHFALFSKLKANSSPFCTKVETNT